MTTPIKPKCYNCKNQGVLNFTDHFCTAFLDGIPDEIFYEGEPHTKPLPNQDNDIVFEPIDETE